ncbi:MAG: glycosyltransferase family 4 protein [Ilumatobacter sp.]|nr:glycosyltransferase family 4 protein [Ilumatobacter sp.]
MTSSPIRLAVDVGPLYGHRTGVGMATAGMVTALGERSDVAVEPYLVSFRSSPRPGHRRLPVPGIVASQVWSRWDRPSGDRWLGSADVVHGTNYVAPPSGRPTVVSVYDCWFLRHPELATPIVRRAGATLRRRVAAGAWVHASSEATAVHVRDLLGTDRVETVHLGVPASASSEETEALPHHLVGAPFVVAIGTEERRKDLPTLVAAFEQLAGAEHELLLVLAGAPGDQSASLDDAISRLPASIRARVHRLGVVDEPSKRWLLRHASVLAYPSLDEGFGFPILEAQAAGTPVVASDVGAVAEIAGDGARLVRDRSTGTFADELSRAVHDTALRLSLIAAGHENLARYSWSSTADALVELYRRAVGEA